MTIDMSVMFLYIVLGIVAGILSGLIGIGGGIIIVPSLVFFFGLTQQQAQGTTLAMLVPPIGILAALTYYKAGFVNIKIALFVALGFVLGSIFGAKLATGISNAMLEKIFGGCLLIIAIKMIFFR